MCGGCPVRAVPGPGQVTVAVFGPDAPPSRLFPGTAAVHIVGVTLKRAFCWLPLLKIVGLTLASSQLEDDVSDHS